MRIIYGECSKRNYTSGFNKRRVAEVAKKLLLQGEIDDETRENLKKITDTIIGKLREQAKQVL